MDFHLTYRGMGHSPALDAFVQEQADGLERFFDGIVSCRVAIELAEARRGRPYHVRIDLRLPGEEIVVNRQPGRHASYEPDGDDDRMIAEDFDGKYKDVYFAVSRAFRAAGRRLQDVARRYQGAVKVHEEQPHGTVVRIAPEGDFGFLQSSDGREIYFNRNSVLDDGFARLKVGSTVAFVEETGDRGPQASTVRIVHRHSAQATAAGEKIHG